MTLPPSTRASLLLRLRDPQFRLARHGVIGERQREPLKLLDQLGREAQERWSASGGAVGGIELGTERAEYELAARAPSAVPI